MFYNLLFIDTNDEDTISVIAYGWNKKSMKFFKQLQQVRSVRGAIHEIAKFNGWDAIFPNNDTALDNVQLNGHIREQLAQEFHLKIKSNPFDQILLNKFIMQISKQMQ